MHQVGDLGGCQPYLLQFFIMREYLSWFSVISDPAVIHNHQALCVKCHILHTVRYQYDRNMAFFLEDLQLIQDLIPSHGIQPGCRLIQDQDLRIHSQYASDRCPAFLSARKLKR